MAFNQHDNSKCIQDTTDINATATDDGNSTPSPDGVKPKTSDTLAVPASSYDNGNCEDENQTECSNLNRELVNKIEVSEEEIRRTNSDGGIRISLDNQNVEGSGTVCQGRRSSMADTQDIKNHAITPGISSKPDRLAHGTYRSAEDEMESNTDEALNTCRTANGYESAPLNLIVKQESTYHHKNAEETGSSNIDSTNNARTDMNEW